MPGLQHKEIHASGAGSAAAIPEPASLDLLVLSILGLFFRKRLRRSQQPILRLDVRKTKERPGPARSTRACKSGLAKELN
jgi:hypothetical protein